MREILLVKSADRQSIWELPGGKVEKDETPLAAAIRELTEETGIFGITLVPKFTFDKAIPHDHQTVWRHHIFLGICAVQPTITIDHQEIIDYQFVTLSEAQAMTELESISRDFLRRIKNSTHRST
jgi:8-oxo-dGTP pyrophosphatase MutT (NUDIX family)